MAAVTIISIKVMHLEHLHHLLWFRTRLRLRLAEQQSLLQHIARQVAVNAVSFQGQLFDQVSREQPGDSKTLGKHEALSDMLWQLADSFLL